MADKMTKGSEQFYMNLDSAANSRKQGLHRFWGLAVRISDVQAGKAGFLVK